MKKIYEFTINKVNKVNKEVQKEIEGKQVTVLEPSEEIEQKKYFIKKPTRTERNEGEEFESIEFSNLVRKGIITRSEVIKRFTTEDVAIEKTYKTYTEKENELQRLSLQEKTSELETKIQNLQKELLALLIEIQDFELTKSSVFNRTADIMARNTTIFWWILNLSYKIEEDKELPIFEGKNFAEKQESYDKILESSENNKETHLMEVIKRFFYFVPAWYSGQAMTEADFKRLDELLKAEEDKTKVTETFVKS